MSLKLNLLAVGRDVALIMDAKGYNVFDVHATYDNIVLMIADDAQDRAANFKISEKDGELVLAVCLETNQPLSVNHVHVFPPLSYEELIKVFLSFKWTVPDSQAVGRIVR